MRIGILALQGDVTEHLNATKRAAEKLKVDCEILEVRTKKELENLDGLIIPGGESTTLMKLIKRENLLEKIKKIKNIFGTCTGSILMSKGYLDLMDFEVERNAYGSQLDSFEKEIETKLGKIKGIFIRAPKIKKIGKNVKVVAKDGKETVGIEEKINGKFYLALTFHPELVNGKLHQYFLEQCH